MWMKNLAVFASATPFAWSVSELNEMLEQMPCKPCGSQDMSSEGFVPPLKGHVDMLVAAQQYVFCTYQETVRLLPGPVVTEELAERVEIIENEQSRKVGRKERAEIKEQIMFEFMPQAFTRSRRTNVIIDTGRNLVFVDAASQNRAEQVINALRKAIGTLPVKPLRADIAPASVFSQWMQNPDSLPAELRLGDRCELKGSKDASATVRFSAVDITQEEILAHLENDMYPSRISLTWLDEIEFDITEEISFKRLKALDLLAEKQENLEADDAVEELQAHILLQAGLIRSLLDVLETPLALKGPAE